MMTIYQNSVTAAVFHFFVLVLVIQYGNLEDCYSGIFYSVAFKAVTKLK